jgi:hypothetical protein
MVFPYQVIFPLPSWICCFSILTKALFVTPFCSYLQPQSFR